VGKTSLLLRFRSGNYSDECAWTPSFDFQEDHTTVDGAAVILRYWDTPGRSECVFRI
jgi:GTPase SAR1 family protein